MATITNSTTPIGTALPPGCGYSSISPTTTSTLPYYPSSVSSTLYNGVPVGPGKIEFQQPAYFQSDVYIDGKSLSETLEKIQERLNIVTPNPKLEAEWEELRELSEKYRQLEKEILQKMAVYNELKK